MASVYEVFNLGFTADDALNADQVRSVEILRKAGLQMVDDELSQNQAALFTSIANSMEDADHVAAIYPFKHISDDMENGGARGHATILRSEARMTPELLTGPLLQCTSLAKITDCKTGLDADNFKKMGKALNEVAKTFSANPCSLECRDAQKGLDKTVWESELGANGLAGIYAAVNDWDSDYYLVVRSSVDKVVDGLRQMVSDSKTPMTVGEFYSTPEFTWAKDAARRNNLRMMYNICRKLGLRIGEKGFNRVEDDHVSATTDTTSHSLMAVADHLQYDSSVDHITFNNDERFGIFNDVVPVSSTSDNLLVFSGYEGGFKFFDAKESAAVIGYPATTAQTKDENHNEVGKHKRSFVWEGKDDNTVTVQEAFPDKTHQFLKEDFEGLLGDLGLENSRPLFSLRATCVKIPTRGQRRPSE